MRLRDRPMTEPEHFRRRLASAIGEKILQVSPLGGGRNSRVFRVDVDGKPPVAVKFYHRHSDDPRDRMTAEYSGLTFLWENGVRVVPRPVENYPDHGFALYEFVDGMLPSAAGIGEEDIDAAIEFLATLAELRDRPGAAALPAASEACFSFADLMANIRSRLDRLAARPEGCPLEGDLERFLSGDFHHVLDRTRAGSRGLLENAGMDTETALAADEKILSPSDFGFHNALRTADHQIIFIDFEYFGWDDPAKTLADFIFHPGMQLNPALKSRFVKGMLNRLAYPERLAVRLEAVLPLYGLKWCLILLNEFLPGELHRRQFAAGDPGTAERIQIRQLEKAKEMLEIVETRNVRNLS